MLYLYILIDLQGKRYYNLYLLMLSGILEAEGDFARILGVNFEGEMTYSKNMMQIDITEFKKGSMFSAEITNNVLQKEFKRYLIFTQVGRLFNEIASCETLEVSDEGCLVLPIEVIFKGQTVSLKVEIPLEEEKFENQADMLRSLYKKMGKLTKYYSSLQKQRHHWRRQIQDFQGKNQKLQNQNQTIQSSSKASISINGNAQPILFKPNQNDAYYTVTNNALKVVTPGIAHHTQIIPQQGIFYYKFKISSTTKYIYVGLCGKNVLNLTYDKILVSDYYMGLFLNDGHFYAYGSSVQGPKPYSIKSDSVIKVLINMNERNMIWYIDDKPVYLAMMRETLFDVHLHPVIILYSANDIIEFLQK